MVSSTFISNTIALESLDTILKPEKADSQHKLLRIQSPTYKGLGILLSFKGKKYREASKSLLKHINLIEDSIIELSISSFDEHLLILLKANEVEFPHFLDHFLEIGEYIVDSQDSELYYSPLNPIYGISNGSNASKLRGGSMASKTTLSNDNENLSCSKITKEVRGENLVENGSEKLRSEILHILTRDERVKKFFPKILDFNFSKLTGYTKVVMPRYFNATDLSQLILDSAIPISSVKECYLKIFTSLFSSFFITKKDYLLPQDYVENLFFSRVYRRTQQVLNEFSNFSPDLNEMIREGFVLNGKEIPSLFTLLSHIKNDRSAMKRLMVKNVYESHHDLIASNIVVNFCRENMTLRDFKLIDCRGESETGKSYRHWFYDLCKAKFFVSGYDLIRREYFSQNKFREMHKLHVNFNFDQSYETVLRYQKINRSFFDIVESASKRSGLFFTDPNWQEKILFGEGFMYIADIPPRIKDEGSEEIAIAFYVYGIQLLMDYVDRYSPLQENKS